MILTILFVGMMFIGTSCAADIDTQDSTLISIDQNSLDDLSNIQEASSDDLNINNLGDPIEKTIYNEKEFQEAVNDLNYSTVLVGNDITLYDGIKINRSNLCIDGQGHTITSINGTIAIKLNDHISNITISNCNFINISASQGSAISIVAANGCSVINCNFTNNNPEFNGAIDIFEYSADCSVINCNFINNSAYKGGAICIDGNNCSVINCTFVNNSAYSYNGGAIAIEGDKCSVINCSFVNNSADERGGAICILTKYHLHSLDSIINCSFINNSAKTNGGGAICLGSTVNTKNLTYHVPIANVTGCIFVNNSADCYGGAIMVPNLIYNTDEFVYIVDCTFDNNCANDYGDVYIGSNGSFINCSFNNLATPNVLSNGFNSYISLIDNDIINGYISNEGHILTPTAFISDSQIVNVNTTVNITSHLYDINGKNGKMNIIEDPYKIDIKFSGNDSEYPCYVDTYCSEDKSYLFNNVITTDIPEGTYNIISDLSSSQYINLTHIGNITFIIDNSSSNNSASDGNSTSNNNSSSDGNSSFDGNSTLNNNSIPDSNSSSDDNSSFDGNSAYDGNSTANLNKENEKLPAMLNTGNPLLILLISLFSICVVSLRSKL